MKVYISLDIEGVTGVTGWDETELKDPMHKDAAAQMKNEAIAACRGALDAGAKEIYVHDSHDSGMNMWIDGFPKEVKFIRSWMYTPDSMFAAGNPLAHTMTSKGFFWVKINGELVSELEYNRLICAKYGVPLKFVSGDKALCDKAQKVMPGIETVPTKEGIGGATVNRSPEVVCSNIRAGVARALKGEGASVPDKEAEYLLELCYREHMSAYKASCFPGVEAVDAHTVRYKAKGLKDLITTFYFIR